MEARFSLDNAKCDCGNQCESLNYEIRLMKLYFRHSQLQMIVESLKFHPRIRQKAFGVSEFLGSIGGLMGLFAGISIMSLIEIMFDFLNALKARFMKVKKLSKIVLVIPCQGLLDETNEAKKKLTINRNHVLFQFSRYFLKFARSSNIHGVNHIVNKEKKPKERIFWFFVTLISTSVCINIVIETVKHSELTPIEFVIDDKIWTLNDVSSG